MIEVILQSSQDGAAPLVSPPICGRLTMTVSCVWSVVSRGLSFLVTFRSLVHPTAAVCNSSIDALLHDDDLLTE